jgi:hypothetical protein
MLRMGESGDKTKETFYDFKVSCLIEMEAKNRLIALIKGQKMRGIKRLLKNF